jgi:type VII secretion protein EccB
MQSRKDLLQAHRLMTQRVGLALLQGEPDPPDRPLRRLNVGTFSSILVAVMVGAVFGIWGLLSPGNAQGLTGAGTLIIDNQTGTNYIWCQGGKLLCPVVNYTSARLALRAATPNQRLVSQASLAHYPRGPMIGIPGLPPLPDAKMLTGAPWSVCVQQVTNPATLQLHTVTTLAGGRGVGGRAVAGGSALLVQAAGNDWVIWHGQRLLVPPGTQNDVLTALADTGQQPEAMPSAWLNAFPQGPDFAPPHVAGFHHPVSGPGGAPARVGQVFATTAVAGSAQRYYLMLGNGLAQITQTQAALLDAVPHQPAQGTVSPSAVAADLAPRGLPASGLPAHTPVMVHYAGTTPLCVVYSGSAAAGPQVTVGGRVPANATATTGSGGLSQIALPPGSAALVGTLAGAQAAGAGGQTPAVSGYYLLTGGRRYGLSSQSVATILGYDLARQRTLLPAGVLDLIPLGPALDPSNAKRQVAG